MSANITLNSALDRIFQRLPSYDFEPHGAALVKAIEPTLKYSEVPQVIEAAAKHFFIDGAIKTFEMLKGHFSNYHWKEQIAVIKTMVSTDRVDEKTALYVLKKLGIYDQGIYNWHELKMPIAELAQPIQLIGNRYGKDAALQALELARDHCAIAEMGPILRDYFNQKFQVQLSDAQFTVTYLRSIGDALFTKKEAVDWGAGRSYNHSPFDPRY